MQEQDPLAEILLPVICPECAHEWRPVFEPGDYLWDEIRSTSQNLFQDVHILARYYSWDEAQILSMTDARRRQYIEMMTQEG